MTPRSSPLAATISLAEPELAPGPLFHHVQEALRRQILDGQYPPGSPLPTEAELCQHFRVSRGTVRRAVDQLVHEGLVYRRQGVGTFVTGAASRINLELMRLRGFIGELRSQGHEAEVVPIERRVALADEALAERLHLQQGDPVVYMKRLLRSGEERLALSEGWYPYRLCAALMDVDPSAAMYRIIEDELGLDIAHAEQAIEPATADEEEAALLEIAPGSLLLTLERVTYLSSGEPVHFGRIRCRADRYKAQFVLRRGPKLRRTAPAPELTGD